MGGTTMSISSLMLYLQYQGLFFIHRKIHPVNEKTLREDHTAAETYYAAKATRDRRKILHKPSVEIQKMMF